jgi:hypothetical protein
MLMEHHAVVFGEPLEGPPNVRDGDRKALRDFVCRRDTSRRQQRLHIAIVDRGFDIVGHVASSYAAAAAGLALIAAINSAVVRISWA